MEELIDHYGGDGLLAAIDAALVTMGRDPGSVTVDDLGPVDEFHVGGRPATRHLIEQLDLAPGVRVLDIGCGLGGTARLLASETGASVTGIDLTEAYVETGRDLNRRVGLDHRIDLRVGSALDLPDGLSVDAAVMLHVGMNIADKDRLFRQVAGALGPGGRFALYDLMRVGDVDVDFPVPWSSSPATSHLAPLADYRRAAEAAGFEVEATEDRTEAAQAFFERLRAGGGGPPAPLGLHLVMGPETPTKVANMVAAVVGGVIAPIELVLRRS